MNIYQKLQSARQFIRKNGASKDGENSFGKYKYFTPEAVESMVQDACDSFGIICLTSLQCDEFGYNQKLQVVDLEKPEEMIVFELRTKHGEVKATNATQQMGSTDTYSDRYVKMKAFCIKENSLDPDAHDASGQKYEKEEKPWYNDFDKHKDAITKEVKDGKSTAQEVLDRLQGSYKVNSVVRSQLLEIK